MEIELNSLKSGNERAFKNIVSGFWIRLFKFASIYTMNEEVAKEIVQDTFLALWENKAELADNTCFATYLLVITRNKCLDYLRKKQLDTISIDKISQENIYLKVHQDILKNRTSDLLMAKELEEVITKAIEDLPEKTKLIFEKSRKEGLMNKEIAEELGVSVKTIEFHINKALTQLRKELNKEHYFMILAFCMLCQ